MKSTIAVAVMAMGLSACGGGGGGGSTPPQPTPVPTATPVPSVSGDMMALTANRGWNYQASSGTNSATVSLYVDPDTLTDGSLVLAGSAAIGLVPTVLTSHANAESALIGGLDVVKSASGYAISAELSTAGPALVPGSPQLVGTTLTLGAVSTPYPGMTATVIAVGTVPGASACPTPASGATVRYTFQGSTYTISYVPGCGMTQVTDPTGQPFTLTSVGTYAIGDLARIRKTMTVTPMDTARTVMGLNHQDFSAAKLLRFF